MVEMTWQHMDKLLAVMTPSILCSTLDIEGSNGGREAVLSLDLLED